MEHIINPDELELLHQIEQILQRGNKAEVERGRDGIYVAEVRRRKIWPKAPAVKKNMDTSP